MKYKDIFRLDNKVTVVTGGSGVIGKELVKGLAESGASVILADSNKKKGKNDAEEMKKEGLKVKYKFLDIIDEKSVNDLIRYIDKEYGKLDIWINSAYPRTEDWGKKLEDVTVSSLQKNVHMHLNGYFLCCQKCAEYMKNQKNGSIINFSSIYGIVGPDFSIYEGTEIINTPIYASIKSGIIGFTRYFASYYGKHNIRVNCISPGGVYDNHSEKFVENYSKKTPLNRMANKEDIVGGAIFLSSDASTYVTGHNLVIDGGWSII